MSTTVCRKSPPKTQPPAPADDPLVTVKVLKSCRDRMQEAIILSRAASIHKHGRVTDDVDRGIGSITGELMDRWSKPRLKELKMAA